MNDVLRDLDTINHGQQEDVVGECSANKVVKRIKMFSFLEICSTAIFY